MLKKRTIPRRLKTAATRIPISWPRVMLHDVPVVGGGVGLGFALARSEEVDGEVETSRRVGDVAVDVRVLLLEDMLKLIVVEKAVENVVLLREACEVEEMDPRFGANTEEQIQLKVGIAEQNVDKGNDAHKPGFLIS